MLPTPFRRAIMLGEVILEGLMYLLVEIIGVKLCTWWGVGLFALVAVCLIGGYIFYKMTGGQV